MKNKKTDKPFVMGDHMHRMLQEERDQIVITKSKKFKEKEQEVLNEYKKLVAERKKSETTMLTDMQEKFVNYYVSKYGERSATQCAIDAGYSVAGAHVRASELLDPEKNPHVVLEIKNRLAMMREQWEVDRDKHMAMLTRIRDEARIKGQYGVVAKCEELRGKVAGLYIEKAMVLTKDMTDDYDPSDKLRSMYKNRDDFDKAMIVFGNELFPDEESKIYGEVKLELSPDAKEHQKQDDEFRKLTKHRKEE